MKTAILGNIIRFKRPKLNIHFGKMLLILFLILGQVLTVNHNEVEASGELYYYEKYYTVDEGYWVHNYNGVILNKWEPELTSVDTGVQYWITNFEYNYNNKPYSIAKSIHTRQSWYEDDEYGNSWSYITGIGSVWQSSATGKKMRSEILLQHNIVGTSTQYPINGQHSDGYWYVRRGVVNINPTITVENKITIENSYFGKVNIR